MTDDPKRLRGALKVQETKDKMRGCVKGLNPEPLEQALCVLKPPDEAYRGVFWTSPAVKVDSDLVVRRWPRCNGLPDEECRIRDDLPVENLSVTALGAVISAKDKDLKNKLSSPGESEFQIIYTLPWEGGGAPPTLSDGTPLMTRVSAQVLARMEEEKASPDHERPIETPDADGAARGGWEDRIVIVGGSYEDAQDIHRTPIGPMPGAMIIANAIRSLHEFGVTMETTPGLKLFAAFLAIVPAAFILSVRLPRWPWCRTALGSYPNAFLLLKSIVALAATIVIMVFWSWFWLDWHWHWRDWLAPETVWLDATFPCAGLIIHQWFEKEEPEEEPPHHEQSPSEGVERQDLVNP